MKLEVLEADYEQSQTDLRLAFKRITDLQAVIEDEMESGEDSDYRCVDSIKACCLVTFKRLENPPIPGCVWSVDTCQFI